MGIESKKPVVIDVRCGSCIFFKRYATYDRPCIQDGIEETSRPCGRYMPAPTPKMKKGLLELGKVIDSFSAKELKSVAAMIRSANRLKANNLRFGQLVIVRIRSGDYMTSFIKARVSGISRYGVALFGKNDMMGLVQLESIIPRPKWKKLKRKMLKTNALDPSLTRKQRTIRRLIELESEPLTIDHAANFISDRYRSKLTLQGSGPKNNGAGVAKIGATEDNANDETPDAEE